MDSNSIISDAGLKKKKNKTSFSPSISKMVSIDLFIQELILIPIGRRMEHGQCGYLAADGTEALSNLAF